MELWYELLLEEYTWKALKFIRENEDSTFDDFRKQFSPQACTSTLLNAWESAIEVEKQKEIQKTK